MPDFLSLLGGRKGHFRYESGHHGGLWFDLDAVFLRASRLEPFTGKLAEILSRYTVEAVCGPLTGGGFLAQLIAAALDVDFIYAERVAPADRAGLYAVQYRIPDSLCGLAAGKRVAIVDDVVSAGSAVRGAFTSLQACGAVPVAVGALLLLGPAAPDYFAGYGIPVERVEYMENDLWAPAECPLCAGKVPLEDFTPDRNR